MNLRRGSDALCLEFACGPNGGMRAPYVSRDVNMFWPLLPEPVIGGQAYRIAPLRAEAWKAKNALFDERTRRSWPNAQLSASARFTRENVLKQFWQSSVDDRLDLDNAIQGPSFPTPLQ